MRRALVLAAALVLVAGCGGEDPPTEGDVINKQFVPAHWEGGWETIYTTDCGYEDEYNYQTGEYESVYACRPDTEQVYEAHHTYVDDAWKLQLEECTTDEGKEKCHKGWIPVDETTYHDYPVGSHYPDPS